MVPKYIVEICTGTLYLVFFILVCTAYTYIANLKRKADDPKKADYLPWAILLMPITFPLILTLAIVVLIFSAVVFGLLLIIFTALLIAFRKPFIFVWLHKIATVIGDPLLKLSTWLLRAAFNIPRQRPESL